MRKFLAIGLCLFVIDPANAAVAFDASSVGAFAAQSSLTWSHTATGTASDGMLVATCYFVTGTAPATATYNGITMPGVPGLGATVGLYTLSNPPTGANNIVVNPGVSDTFGCVAESFTGVASGFGVGGVNSIVSSPISCTWTIPSGNNNGWDIGFGYVAGTGLSAMTITSGGTLRKSTLNSTTNGVSIGDSNGIAATGSNTVTFGVTNTTISGYTCITLQLLPAFRSMPTPASGIP